MLKAKLKAKRPVKPKPKFNLLIFMLNNLELVKTLRQKTGAGMADCQQALAEAVGDLDKAIIILRKKGLARAAKRSQRETTQGQIKVAVDSQARQGYIFELNAETDFVVRNQKFQSLADQILELVKTQQPKNLNQLLTLPLAGATVKQNLEELSGVLGEKLEILKYNILSSSGTIAAYLHAGGKIGVLVALDQSGKNDLAYEMAMQIAAANPKYISPEEASSDEMEKEQKIYREELKNQGKKAELIEKIIPAKLAKYLAEICLTKQEYIRDEKKRVEEILGPVKVEKFIRFSL